MHYLHGAKAPQNGCYFNPTPAINGGAIYLFLSTFIAIPAGRNVAPMKPEASGVLPPSCVMLTFDSQNSCTVNKDFNPRRLLCILDE